MQMIGSKGTRLAEGAMAAEGYVDLRVRGISVCVRVCVCGGDRVDLACKYCRGLEYD